MLAMSRCATPEAGQLEAPSEGELEARSLVASWAGEEVLDEVLRLAPRLALFPEEFSAVSTMMLSTVIVCEGSFATDLDKPDTEMDS
jgi:hypothetical protein